MSTPKIDTTPVATTEIALNSLFNGSKVRTIIDSEGNPWFCALDVASAVGYSNAEKAVHTHIPERKPIAGIPTPPNWGGLDFSALFGNNFAAVSMLSEAMVYKFLIRGQSPKGELFVDWLTSEVLPSLRKTGTYSLPGVETANEQQVAELEAAIEELESNACLRTYATVNQYLKTNKWANKHGTHQQLLSIARTFRQIKAWVKLNPARLPNDANAKYLYHTELLSLHARWHGREYVPTIFHAETEALKDLPMPAKNAARQLSTAERVYIEKIESRLGYTLSALERSTAIHRMKKTKTLKSAVAFTKDIVVQQLEDLLETVDDDMIDFI